jgi:hypothetical protein
MLNFDDLVRGYERDGDKEALLHLRGLVERFFAAGEGHHSLIRLAIEQQRGERLAVLDEALGRVGDD